MTHGLFEHRSESVITKAMTWLLLDEEYKAAQRCCKQLIDGGVAAMDWLELFGKK